MKRAPLLGLMVLAFAATARGGGIPDLVQTDPKGGFARGGVSFCAPVAVSNSLLVLLGDRWKGSQYDLVNKLASADYLRTDPVEGTGPNGVMRGVKRFLADQGFAETGFSIGFQGWRPHAAEFSAGGEKPDPAWMAEALATGGAAWVNVGWYRTDAATGDRERIGGHWVTVVAVSPGEPWTVTIHDPSPRTGLKPWSQKVTLTRLAKGRLTGKDRNLPRAATGHWEMAGEMVIKQGADCAIVDGVVGLRMNKAGREKQ